MHEPDIIKKNKFKYLILINLVISLTSIREKTVRAQTVVHKPA